MMAVMNNGDGFQSGFKIPQRPLHNAVMVVERA
jgi:hypothetical protein